MIGLVYCLTSPHGKKYVGSTTCSLGQRFSAHKTASKTGRSPLYKAMREDNNLSDWTIETMRQAEIDAKAELYGLEAECIKLLNTIEEGLNMRLPNRTSAQLYLDKRLEILEKRKVYYQENAERLKKKALERYHRLKRERIIQAEGAKAVAERRYDADEEEEQGEEENVCE